LYPSLAIITVLYQRVNNLEAIHLPNRDYSSIIAGLQVETAMERFYRYRNKILNMAKKLLKQVKVQAIGGKATPAPPLGPVLGQAGINIGEFVNQFNEQTRERMGEVVPTVINVYDDRSFDFIVKVSPMSRLILKKIGKDKGSSKNLVTAAGQITKAQVREVAEEKMPDLNAASIEAAMKIVEGSCFSMGIKVVD
jgi:large subunit ribosomal protein L11